MSRKESKVGCENLKVMLYRAIQDVPWCKVSTLKGFSSHRSMVQGQYNKGFFKSLFHGARSVQ